MCVCVLSIIFHQAVRSSVDLNCMSVPNKYKTIGHYYKVCHTTCDHSRNIQDKIFVLIVVVRANMVCVQ